MHTIQSRKLDEQAMCIRLSDDIDKVEIDRTERFVCVFIYVSRTEYS